MKSPKKINKMDDRPLTAEEAEAFLEELKANEYEELQEWAKTAEQAIILLTRENKRLRAEIDHLIQLLDDLNQ